MATIVKTGRREVTITNSSDTVIINVSRALPNYRLEVLLLSYTLTIGQSKVITYDNDGIYVIAITETTGLMDTVYYTDLCIENIYDHIETDVMDILSAPIANCTDPDIRYDFMTLLLLSLQAFGNTNYSLYETDGIWSVLPSDLQLVEDAIVRSTLYMELNSSSTQSTNI